MQLNSNHTNSSEPGRIIRGLEKIGNYRWTICALVFFATTVNYLDRQVIALLKDDYLEPLFGWSETDYSNIVIAFQIAYAIGMLFAGWFIDKVGTKIGYAISLTVWSIAAILHSFARSTLGFAGARALLGVSEAGNFPAANKTTAEWFPKKERALAFGIFNSGTNVGAILAPMTVPIIAMTMGWQWAFILTGAFGLLWLVFWVIFYDIPQHQKRLKKPEYDYIHSDDEPGQSEQQPVEKVKWSRLLNFRQSWAFVVGKFMTDPIWWFYLFWLPSFLNKQYGMTKTDLVWPLATVYMMTTFGSVFGGWLSGYLINKKWEVYKARRTAMLTFALCVVPVVMSQALGKFNPWFAILIIGLAAASHQAWSANLFTTASDMFPKKAVASVTGLGGMAGAVGGILISRIAGVLLDHFKGLGHIETGYYIMFVICGSAYILAWIIFNILAPKMKKVNLE
jgi:MFS transporter, ACS family, aldohexuronate transporter